MWEDDEDENYHQYWDDEESTSTDDDDDCKVYNEKLNWLGDPWPYVAGDPAY